MLSDLRLALVEQRLRRQPAALDGVEGAEVATAAVQGVDGLAAYFGRYLPQLVLACLVPVAVLVRTATVDVESALIMLATLPLVPRVHVADRACRPSAGRASGGTPCSGSRRISWM